MGKVKPKTELIETIRDDEQVIKALKEVEFDKQTAMPIEVTLWCGYAGKASDKASGGMVVGQFRIPFPLIFDCAIYWDRNNALLLSLFLDYNDYMFFRYNYNTPSISNNTFVLPGIGYEFRTTGLFTAGFVASFYLGAVVINAVDSMTTGMPLSAGETAVRLFNYLNMKLILGFNPTKELGIKTNIGAFLPVSMFIKAFNQDFDPGYSTDGSWMIVEFFTIGISYRM